MRFASWVKEDKFVVGLWCKYPASLSVKGQYRSLFSPCHRIRGVHGRRMSHNPMRFGVRPYGTASNRGGGEHNDRYRMYGCVTFGNFWIRVFGPRASERGRTDPERGVPAGGPTFGRAPGGNPRRSTHTANVSGPMRQRIFTMMDSNLLLGSSYRNASPSYYAHVPGAAFCILQGWKEACRHINEGHTAAWASHGRVTILHSPTAMSTTRPKC